MILPQALCNLLTTLNMGWVDVRFGSKADMAAHYSDVCFTPKSRHWNSVAQCLLCAKSGHSPNDCLKLNQLKEHHSAGFQS